MDGGKDVADAGRFAAVLFAGNKLERAREGEARVDVCRTRVPVYF